LGEILIKVFVKHPRRANPKGASGVGDVKPIVVRSEPSTGTKPRNRILLGRPDASAWGTTAGETVSGCILAETSEYLSRGQASKGRIPRALPVRNRTGQGPKGVSRQEGTQTLKADRSGQVKPANEWTFDSDMCCREQKLMRGADGLRSVG
jgi:hypothetical protein